MRLIFHGQLKEEFGDSVDMAVETAADAIEGFSRQAPNWPTATRVSVVGDGERLDTDLKLRSSYKEVHIFPAFTGGGGKFTNIILGAAVVASAFVLPGLGVTLSAALHASLIVSGSMLIAQGVIGLFMKSPKMTTANDPEASKYLSVNKNTTAVGTPITMAWGCIELGGHWVSLQSDSNNLSYGVFPA